MVFKHWKNEALKYLLGSNGMNKLKTLKREPELLIMGLLGSSANKERVRKK